MVNEAEINVIFEIYLNKKTMKNYENILILIMQIVIFEFSNSIA